MTEFKMPDLPADTNSITDIDAVNHMKQLKRHRRDKGVMIPRFVQQLNKSGFRVSLSDYKQAEEKPYYSIVLIRAGMLAHAYRVLNKTRVANSPQDPITEDAMIRLSARRVESELTYLDMAERISVIIGIPVSESEYRTAEQGITKIVPYSWVIAAERILKP